MDESVIDLNTFLSQKHDFYKLLHVTCGQFKSATGSQSVRLV
jgi:hypothetical protein